ncbi:MULTISPECIES: BCCT family transporter [Stutzerimonas]|jgi:choline/glycine/proline betaine transport protein|uniref:Choline transporter n=2 Tax=Stutzerimonas TaxID=2901164 RepID=I4CMV8_STUST|nr:MULTISPECIES: BCCT family transporter [Stutzerimonas]KKJ99003.1 choline transporter [Stutzerimonas stutzeri]MAF86524.1 choline transporter [Pseudomonas sp.]MBU0563490.1 BCCT family transporter [Gammaproteobacteria bacterium]MCB4795337.1 BCCT family transporter [Pseudomonas sp. NP21570]OCX96695.1 MAG: choline transporter [Pseudomonas sp. K35]|tara:strand:- start:5782 stop:7839 length:2058 start_codon:yes stop_codon:yes gene_type:complete
MDAAKKIPKAIILFPVFIPAVIVTLLLVIGTISNPELAGEVFSSTLAFITTNFGWFYMLSVAFFLVFIVGIAMTPWGSIKLGPDHAEPQYSFPAWFAMLFSAGYGIALLFFGVAEPVLHYASPPAGAGETVDAAKQAMQIAFFHWGFHIWAIYGLTGLVLAYFSFRHGLPLSMRSALYPIIGERIYGPIGHVVDVFAILGTLFGIATTLGLSVTQINAGINYLWPSIPISINVQIIAIAIITGLAICSVVAGLDKGVKNLSLLNMILAIGLMLFVFLVGPTIFILETFLQNTGSYLNNIIERTFNLQAYSRSDWIGNWTLFIFGWTIAWSPFVGLFIAKISRGRTIRQFVFGVMFVPTIFTFLWFSVFGDTALHMIMVEGYTSLISDVQADNAIALFKLFELLPMTSIASFLAVVLIITFFVTSSDSGSLVIDSLAAGGALHTPVWQRVFWASIEGVVASALLLAGGLSALQTMTIASALPFAIIMMIAALGMWRALVIEGHHETSLQSHMQGSRLASNAGPGLWKKRLAGMVSFPSREEVDDFMNTTVLKAMRRVQRELSGQEWAAEVHTDEAHSRLYLEVIKDDQVDFIYEIRAVGYAMPAFALTEGPEADEQYYRAEVFLRRGGQHYDVYGYDQADIISDILDQFEKYLHFLHISPGSLPWKMAEHDEMLSDDQNTPKPEAS